MSVGKELQVMMLFVCCEGCGVPLRSQARRCVRCRTARENNRRRLTAKVKAARRNHAR
jgi:hypothetical protein